MVESGVLYHHSLEPISPLFKDLLILLAILIILVEIYRNLHQIWLRHLLLPKKSKRSRKLPVLCPKSETAASVRKISGKGRCRNAKRRSPGS